MKRKFKVRKAFLMFLAISVIMLGGIALNQFGISDSLLCSIANAEELNYEEIYNYSVKNGEIEIKGMNSPLTGEITIPDEIEGYPVTAIASNAFKSCTSISHVKLPDSIKKIGISAFEGCTALESINIPDGVTTISQNTFYGCSSLDNIIIPDSITEIGIRAFQNCTNLKNLNIGNKVTSIRTEAFLNCKNLTSVTFPKTLKIIWPYAFHNCDSLDKIIIPDSVTYLGESAFGHCINATELVIGNGITHLESTVFWYCSKIEEVVVPEAIKEIPDHFFDTCTSLKKITLHDDIKSIGIHAFYATKIETIDLPESLETISASAFFSCKKLKSINIPQNVSLIESGAFNFCPSIERFNVSSENKHYSNDEYGALFDKNKTTLLRYPAGKENATYIIPKSVNSISNYAFMDCSNLKELVFENAISEVKLDVINRAGNLVCIHIPSSVTSITSKYTGSAYICSDSENSPAKAYAETSGVDFVVCDGTHPEYFNAKFKIEDQIITETFKRGDIISVPTVTENENCVFDAWIDDEGNIAEIPELMPNKNLSFTAKYRRIVKSEAYDVSVSFDESDFTEDENLQLKNSKLVVREEKTDGETAGWFRSEMKDNSSIKLIYYINLTDEFGNKIDLKDKFVTVKIKIPFDLNEDFENADFFVSHRPGNPDKYKFEMYKGNEVKYEKGYIVFNVNHFSQFAICIENPAKNISIASLPTKTSYTYKMDSLDLSGLALTVTYSDGTTENVTDTSKMKVTGFDNSKTGEQTVTVEYEGFTAEFNVNVKFAWWQWIIRILLLGFLWY